MLEQIATLSLEMHATWLTSPESFRRRGVNINAPTYAKWLGGIERRIRLTNDGLRAPERKASITGELDQLAKTNFLWYGLVTCNFNLPMAGR